jgi:urea carboxylase
MEGPGGYQLVGRTIQMWNRWRQTECFEKPWLLRFFDRLRFFPVSGEELVEARAAFPHGRYPLRIEEGRFTLREHEKFLAANAEEIASFKSRQQRAFYAERHRWRDLGLDSHVADADTGAFPMVEETWPEGMSPVHASTTGTVWKLEVSIGETVIAGQTLIVTESMKMEIAITAPVGGKLRELRCQPGRVVRAGQIVALIGEN